MKILILITLLDDWPVGATGSGYLLATALDLLTKEEIGNYFAKKKKNY